MWTWDARHSDALRRLGLLLWVSAILPRCISRKIIRAVTPIPAIGYTNLGVIDENGVRLDGLLVDRCYMTGTYKPADRFQLSVSTFRGSCTLSCNMADGANRVWFARRVLAAVRDDLLGL